MPIKPPIGFSRATGVVESRCHCMACGCDFPSTAQDPVDVVCPSCGANDHTELASNDMAKAVSAMQSVQGRPFPRISQ